MRRGIVASAFQPPRANLTYRGFSSWLGNVCTFSIGDPSPTREVIVQVSTAESNWNFPMGLKIGGTIATKDAGYASTYWSSALYRLAVPGGTTVEVYEPHGSYGVSFIVWTVDRAVAVHDYSQAAIIGSGSVTVDTVAGGFAIGTLLSQSPGFSPPMTQRARNVWSASADTSTDGSSLTANVTTDGTRYFYLVSYKPN